MWSAMRSRCSPAADWRPFPTAAWLGRAGRTRRRAFDRPSSGLDARLQAPRSTPDSPIGSRISLARRSSCWRRLTCARQSTTAAGRSARPRSPSVGLDTRRVMPWGERPTGRQPARDPRQNPADAPRHPVRPLPRRHPPPAPARPYPIRRADPLIAASTRSRPASTALMPGSTERNRPCGPLGGSQTHHQQPGGAPIRPDRPPSRPHHPHAGAFRLAHVPMTRPPSAHHPRPGDRQTAGRSSSARTAPISPRVPRPPPPGPPTRGQGASASRLSVLLPPVGR